MRLNLGIARCVVHRGCGVMSFVFNAVISCHVSGPKHNRTVAASVVVSTVKV